MKQHFSMFAAYNEWANQAVYDAASELSPQELWADAGLFFGSVGGTLNHLIVADRIWLARFTGQGETPKSLDTIVHRELDALRAAREAEDERIVTWIAGLKEPAFAGRFTYVTVTDVRTVSQRLSPALAHFFNHQTHHRGHLHAAFTRLGKSAPSLDLIYFQRTKNGRKFA